MNINIVFLFFLKFNHNNDTERRWTCEPENRKFSFIFKVNDFSSLWVVFYQQLNLPMVKTYDIVKGCLTKSGKNTSNVKFNNNTEKINR